MKSSKEKKQKTSKIKTNKKSKVLLVLILGGCFYLSWKHSSIFLSYLKVIIWPVVFLIFIFMFRQEVKTALSKLIKIDTPIASLTLSQDNQKSATEETAHVLTAEANVSIVASATATLTADAEVTHSPDQNNQELIVQPTAESESRTVPISSNGEQEVQPGLAKDAVEQYMKVSAAWGYNMALIGFKSPPVPEIDWDEDRPQIKFGSGSTIEENLGARVLTVKEQTERDMIIREILGIRKELNGLSVYDRVSMGIGPSAENVLKYQLREMKKLLQKIDPTSIFLTDDYD